ncbi:tail spike protein [Corynebacterium phage phi674]|uniref:Putative tail fiber protein n=1 Tax=Corynebacterium phage phi674 TaxID=2052822 RepID=A0A2H4PIX9_9CAUD|nr:tail spike protein [Corynebacterium phage phi674]ATW62937.1 putative tail fiber protein [Corynebacterium phage phi674]
MTLVKIDIRNVASETHPDDRVLLRSATLREASGGGLISTAETSITLVDGVGEVELAPGSVVVNFQCRGISDTRAKSGTVPDEGTVDIAEVIEEGLTFTPPVVNRALDLIRSERDHLLTDMETTVSEAVEGELGTAVRSAQAAAVTAEQEATSANARATSAESSAGNAVTRVEALEAMGGLSPESPVDGQTANLVTQAGTLTRDAVNATVHAGSGSVSVTSFGALGDGVADDTEAINAAIQYAYSQGIRRVTIPNGVYMIRADDPDSPSPYRYLQDSGGIELLSGIHLEMSADATLKAIPNAEPRYCVIRVYHKENVKISGGRIIGDRYEHTGTTGEWGYGIAVTAGENIIIEDVYCADFWGDGINVQRLRDEHNTHARNVIVRNCTSTGNRRQGMSVEGVEGLRVQGGEFSHTNGTHPQAGIDLEPASEGPIMTDIKITDVLFRGNNGSGLQATMVMNISDLVVEGCTFESNRTNGNNNFQFRYYSHGNNVTVRNCLFLDTPVDGGSIGIQGGTNVLVEGCRTDGQISYGRRPTMPAGDIVIRNCVVSTDKTPNALIMVSDATIALVEGNEVEVTNGSGSNVRGIYLASRDIDNVVVRGNTVRGTNWGIETTTPGPKLSAIENNTIEWTHLYGIRVRGGDVCSITGNRVNNSHLGNTESSNTEAVPVNATGMVILRGNTISKIPYPGLPPEMVGKESAFTVGIGVASNVGSLLDAGGNVGAGDFMVVQNRIPAPPVVE